MPVFKDDQEVYQYIGKLFQDLADDDELGPQVPPGGHDRAVPLQQPRLADHGRR